MSGETNTLPLLFSLQSGRDLLDRVADILDVPPAPGEEREFEDGEFKIRPLCRVRDRTAVIVQPLCAAGGLSVNDILLRVFCLIGALRDAGATRLHLIAPYLCYARKDRRTKSRDPLSLRYLAQLFEAMHLDRIVVAEVHNPAAFENAFRIPASDLDGILITDSLPAIRDRVAALGNRADILPIAPSIARRIRSDFLQ